MNDKIFVYYVNCNYIFMIYNKIIMAIVLYNTTVKLYMKD